MKEKRMVELQYDTTLDSPLSSLVRSLYLYGVEHCALAIGTEYPVYTKDQIISTLERGNPDRKIREVMTLLSLTSFYGLIDRKLLEPATPVLLVTENGVEVIAAERLPEALPLETQEEIVPKDEIPVPQWWEIPLPLVLFSGKKTLMNPAARDLFDGASIPALSRKKRQPKEFLLEISSSKKKKKSKESRHILFTELESPVFLVQDVTEELRNAEQLTWWASIGQAFISDLKCKGKIVRQIRSPDQPSEDETVEQLACIWEEKLLGYICVDDRQLE